LTDVFVTLAMRAFPMDQVQQHCCPPFRKAREHRKRNLHLWDRMRNLFVPVVRRSGLADPISRHVGRHENTPTGRTALRRPASRPTRTAPNAPDTGRHRRPGPSSCMHEPATPNIPRKRRLPPDQQLAKKIWPNLLRNGKICLMMCRWVIVVVINTVRILRLIGPRTLAVLWLICILLAWAAAGRHSGLVDWVILAALAVLIIGFALKGSALITFKIIRGRHQRFEQRGAQDVHHLAYVARRRFGAGHYLLAGLLLLVTAGAARLQIGLPVSAFFLALGLVPFVVVATQGARVNRGAEAVAMLFEHAETKLTRTGRQAIAALSYKHRVEDALRQAHGPQGSIAASEVLGVLRHAHAFWPKLEPQLLSKWSAWLKWRAAAMLGLAGHAVSAGLVAWLLALWIPVKVLPPLPSPLALLAGQTPEDQSGGSEEARSKQIGAGEDGNESDGEDGASGEGGGGDTRSEGEGQSQSGQGEGSGEQGTGDGPGQSDDGSETKGSGSEGHNGDGDGGAVGEEPQDGETAGGDQGGDGAGQSGGTPDAPQADTGEEGKSEGQGGGDESGEGASDDTEPRDAAPDAETEGDGESARDETNSTAEPETQAEAEIANPVDASDPNEPIAPVLETPPEEGREGAENAVPSGSSAGTLDGDQAVTFDPSGQSHPFAASGAAPEGLTIFQEELPSYPDNLLPPPPPSQRLPSWIVEFENAGDE